jgi:hypothetical protein
MLARREKDGENGFASNLSSREWLREEDASVEAVFISP